VKPFHVAAKQWRTQKISEGGQSIGVARGGKGAMPPNFLENLVILCFERSFSKQNSAICRKFNILVYTAEYCIYIFLFLGPEGGAWHSTPPPYVSAAKILYQ